MSAAKNTSRANPWRWLKRLFAFAFLTAFCLAIWFGAPFIGIDGNTGIFDSILMRAILISGFLAFTCVGWLVFVRGAKSFVALLLAFLALIAGLLLLLNNGDPGWIAATIGVATTLSFFAGPGHTGIKAGFFTSLILVSGAFGWLGLSQMNKSQLAIDEVKAVFLDYGVLRATLPVSPISDRDFAAIAPALSRLKDAALIAEDSGASQRLFWHGDLMQSAGRQAYRDGLNELLLPRLVLMLEKQLRANMDNRDFLLEALRVYLMLGLQGPMDTQLVQYWISLGWEQSSAGPTHAELAAALSQHLEDLLSQPMNETSLDAALVQQVQQTLSQLPKSELIYRGILIHPKAQALADWSIVEAGGPDFLSLFEDANGTAGLQRHQGIFTKRGFHDVFLPLAVEASLDHHRLDWVLGAFGPNDQSNDAPAKAVLRQVLNHYYQDYANNFQQAMDDLQIMSSSSLDDSFNRIALAAGSSSPLRRVIREISTETQLVDQDPPQTSLGSAIGLTDSSLKSLLSRSRLKDVLEDALRGEPLGLWVQNRFKNLHGLTKTDEGRPSLLDQMLLDLNSIVTEPQLSGVANTSLSPSALFFLARFEAQADRFGQPMARLAAQLTQNLPRENPRQVQQDVNAAWTSGPQAQCRAATEGRYPFNDTSPLELSIADFANLFGPGGTLEQFASNHLDVDVDLNPDALLQIERARDIRAAFFATGADGPVIPFGLTIDDLSGVLISVSLQLGKTEMEGVIGEPSNTVQLKWPSDTRDLNLTVVADLFGGNETVSIPGDWALFRLLHDARWSWGFGHDRANVKMDRKSINLLFETQSAVNPFNLKALQEFECPVEF